MRLIEALKAPALALTTVVALGSCAANSKPDVQAQLKEAVEVVVNDELVTLDSGTEVSADCRSTPIALRVEIEDGPYEGEHTNIRHSALEATSDPYGAWPGGNDPFAPLPSCE